MKSERASDIETNDTYTRAACGSRARVCANALNVNTRKVGRLARDGRGSTESESRESREPRGVKCNLLLTRITGVFAFFVRDASGKLDRINRRVNVLFALSKHTTFIV